MLASKFGKMKKRSSVDGAACSIAGPSRTKVCTLTNGLSMLTTIR